jgi:hypothetical protein
MTQDEIIEMAKQVDREFCIDEESFDWIEAFAKLVAQHERDECAKVCEERWKDSPWLIEAAAAIRARGEA